MSWLQKRMSALTPEQAKEVERIIREDDAFKAIILAVGTPYQAPQELLEAERLGIAIALAMIARANAINNKH
jgi:hypothetical protein